MEAMEGTIPMEVTIAMEGTIPMEVTIAMEVTLPMSEDRRMAHTHTPLIG